MLYIIKWNVFGLSQEVLIHQRLIVKLILKRADLRFAFSCHFFLFFQMWRHQWRFISRIRTADSSWSTYRGNITQPAARRTLSRRYLRVHRPTTTTTMRGVRYRRHRLVPSSRSTSLPSSRRASRYRCGPRMGLSALNRPYRRVT